MQTLPMIDYVAVDGGPERGMQASSTIEPLTNTLLANGFHIVAFNVSDQMGRALFRSNRLLEQGS
jgi:hypothetical protein